MAKLNLEEVKTSIFSTKIEVHVGYINAGNHLGHDSLVLLLQEVRERFFQSLGESELSCCGLGIMIINLAVEYFREGTYGDILTIKLGLGKIGSSSFEFIYQVYNQNQIEIARARTTSVFCNKDRKSASIPEKILKTFNQK